MLKRAAGAECVSAPTEMRSGPAAASGAATSGRVRRARINREIIESPFDAKVTR